MTRTAPTPAIAPIARRIALALALAALLAACAGEDAAPGGATPNPTGSAPPAAPAAADGTSAADAAPAPTTAEVIANAPPADWRRPADADLLVLELATGGRAVIELAPDFAPRHVERIRALAGARYWDGLVVLRSQDNYVIQWGDPAGGTPAERALPAPSPRLPAEFDRAAAGLPFTALADGDVYAPEAGWSRSFPAARDPAEGRAWLAHCYGTVGAGRDLAADSSNGSELYLVTGHAPRHLDRNITSVGRVLQGMEHLSVLPRGTGPLGFYTDPAQHVGIVSLRLASDLPEAQRPRLEVLDSASPSFERLVEARRHRGEAWFIDPVGHVELCNVPIPVREVGAADAG
jgi:peptidylprolyl isomerase